MYATCFRILSSPSAAVRVLLIPRLCLISSISVLSFLFVVSTACLPTLRPLLLSHVSVPIPSSIPFVLPPTPLDCLYRTLCPLCSYIKTMTGVKNLCPRRNIFATRGAMLLLSYNTTNTKRHRSSEIAVESTQLCSRILYEEKNSSFARARRFPQGDKR